MCELFDEAAVDVVDELVVGVELEEVVLVCVTKLVVVTTRQESVQILLRE